MDSSPAPSPTNTLRSDIAQLNGMLHERRFAEAEAGAQALLARIPGQREALLCLAVAQRLLGRLPEARATLQVLEQAHPRFALLHEERGRCLAASGETGRAIQSLRHAVHLNPALVSSWSMLEGLYRAQGDTANMQMAAAQGANMRSLPQELIIATGLFAEGNLERAEAVIRPFLQKHRDHVEAMRLLARIAMAHRIYPDAQILLQGVLQRAPGHRLARIEHASVLNHLHRFREAQRELELLLKEEPQDWVLRMLHASAVVGLGEHERAVRLYQGLLAGGPQDCVIHLLIGHGYKTLGRSSEAVQAYRRAASCREDFGDAYWSLADLKTYRFTDAERAAMARALDAPATAPEDRAHLCFALAKALEDRGEFAESFRLYEQGNGLKLRECRYLPEPTEINTREQIRVCTAEFFASRRGWGSMQPGPIFIVGLPRSGSTLLEQILASHSQVEGTSELPTIQQMVNRLRGFAPEPDPENPNYPRMLADLRAADFTQLGEQYLADTRVYRSGKPYFIDKMPNNFRHVGLLHLMLPNARIIDARREPMSCCFSNFKQLFASGQEFTYSFENIARYYRTYLQLMRHWDAVLPGRVLRVLHEDVVDDLEGSVRRMLQFCGLEFEPQCLAFHENKRSVRTSSAEQVRRGISRAGLEQWKNFEPWLGPLREQLGEALTAYRE